MGSREQINFGAKAEAVRPLHATHALGPLASRPTVLIFHLIHTMNISRPICARVHLVAPRCRSRGLSPFPRFYATRDRTSDRIPTNDPNPAEPVQNVSDTNATPMSPMGLRDSSLPLQEMPEDSERQRTMQAPNRKEVWSRSQQPRESAMSGPRFEQTIMEYQVRPNWRSLPSKSARL